MSICECKNDVRIRRLEHQEAIMGIKIESLIKQLDELTNTLKTLVWLMIPTILGVLGFLIMYWIKGGEK